MRRTVKQIKASRVAGGRRAALNLKAAAVVASRKELANDPPAKISLCLNSACTTCSAGNGSKCKKTRLEISYYKHNADAKHKLATESGDIVIPCDADEHLFEVYLEPFLEKIPDKFSVKPFFEKTVNATPAQSETVLHDLVQFLVYDPDSPLAKLFLFNPEQQVERIINRWFLNQQEKNASESSEKQNSTVANQTATTSSTDFVRRLQAMSLDQRLEWTRLELEALAQQTKEANRVLERAREGYIRQIERAIRRIERDGTISCLWD